MEIIEFHREQKDINPFLGFVEDPVFRILVLENGQVKEKVINLKGRFPLTKMVESEGFEEEAYRNYEMLSEFLEDKEEIMKVHLGLNEEEYARFLFQLYLVLVRNHAICGWFKKKLLIILGYLKYYSGRLGINR